MECEINLQREAVEEGREAEEKGVKGRKRGKER